jgi:hypothetical protein
MRTPQAPGGDGGAAAAAAMGGVAAGLLGAFGKSAVRSFGTVMGREVSRGLFGGMRR